MNKNRQNAAPGKPPPASGTGSRRYQSQTLFDGQQEIIIEHAGHDYRLRITRQDKLILTK